MTSTALADFRAAAEAHLHAASTVVVGSASPQATPGSMAYLACVAVECSLKALILKQLAALTTDDLKTKQPRVHEALFASKDGHRLDKLAERARLKQHLTGDAPEARAHDVWRRMCAGTRPYSLRYASERISVQDARAEHEIAKQLHEDVKGLLGRSQR